MTVLDWIIVAIPLVALLGVAWFSKRYARDVVDYLAAGRIAGRYVLAVGGLEGSLSVITLIAGCEKEYQTGFGLFFWSSILAPIGIFISLTGYCVYRWRETRCLSLGQFLELRYGSKFFRVFCATVRTIADLLTNAIGPAIATNFFIYYLGLPHRINIWGMTFPTYGLVLFVCIVLAVCFIWPSGRISLLITDCFQGLLSYPIFVAIVIYILLHFSWWNDIAPVMWNRVPGQSFMNPYDMAQFRDFNLFALVVTLCGQVLGRANWMGNDNGSAARSAHEQKMSGILGAWRNGFASMMMLLLALVVIVFMNSPHFVEKNRLPMTSVQVRHNLCERVLDQVVNDPAQVQAIVKKVDQIPNTPPGQDFTRPISQQNNHDTPYFETVRKELGDAPQARYNFLQFRALYHQMMTPMVIRQLFPPGMVGLFCLLMVMLLVSTDDSRIFNVSATFMQDLVLPFFRGRVDPKNHLLLLRLTTLVTAGLFMFAALVFSQVDYIQMFITIIAALWTGGAGPIMIFGLYSHFGNVVGAWCSIVLGTGTTLVGLFFQRNWTMTVYPWLEKMEWVTPLDQLLRTVSGPFNPLISWQMDPVKFPINSYEIFFISTILSLTGYIVGSLLFYRRFNLEKLLHRGIYSDKPQPPAFRWTFRTVLSKMIGINQEYSRGDKVIAYAVFGYSFVYRVLLAFLFVVVWNAFFPWPHNWWTIKFFITNLLVPGIVGVISTVWFMWGGIRDSRQLFIDLEKRKVDASDNGQVLAEDKD